MDRRGIEQASKSKGMTWLLCHCGLCQMDTTGQTWDCGITLTILRLEKGVNCSYFGEKSAALIWTKPDLPATKLVLPASKAWLTSWLYVY